MQYIEIEGYKIAKILYDFVNQEVLVGTGIQGDNFWREFTELANELTGKNQALLDERQSLQSKIDEWHKNNKDEYNFELYEKFLKQIGYIETSKGDFTIATQNVDDEIAKIAAPQLVVPVLNERFALNAANARWGSLYDALYGTDVIAEPEKIGGYNEVRGKKVIEWARNFLEKAVPLQMGSWHNIENFQIENESLVVVLDGGEKTSLQDVSCFVGFRQSGDIVSNILLRQNNLHIDIVIDKNNTIGKTDKAGIADIILESALTSIMDNEDSISAVDGEDKVLAYRNWLGLIKGNLESSFEKNGKTIVRKLNQPRVYQAVGGGEIELKSQVLMLHRNVGHLMRNNAIIDKDGNEIFEGLLDAAITALIGIHDVGNEFIKGRRVNSPCGSIYIVKPKMHGGQEVAFAVEIFAGAERLAKLPPNTIKIGIMDEERRMSVNLKEAIRAAHERVVFINTGFLDRTGDEIFTSMEAGIMIRKADMKQSNWIRSYEQRNVDIGLSCGFFQKAQIGKGMWAAPDKMADMLEQKISHPQSGANTAWVPSPTAATLHAVHYHQFDVVSHQKQMLANVKPSGSLQDILDIPLASKPNWNEADILQELENNSQGILGYVVRWIDQGIGCSKVPDINNIGLMEDRATLRISSQHIANWLYHGVVNKEQVVSTMQKMAKIVDEQNVHDKNYEKMDGNFEKSIAFQAALDLVLKARIQPSGYTEPLLHFHRLSKKNEK